jgi:iron complex outermembrane receptor protein
VGQLSCAALAGSACAVVFAHAAFGAEPEDLSGLSLEQLGDVQVTSVSKFAQSIGDAPSAVFVISHGDIESSGARSLPEILRLAPNLSVAQVSASRYVITARGFNGSQSAQNFSNKLLVLIDGRTVYSPLYSGVYWDAQDVLPEDIDRIEVISGPGATLWGANAVNGVINIITRAAAQTQGGFVEVAGGNQERRAGLRYGGRVSADLSYRVYLQSFFDRDTDLATGGSANDHWSKPQGGFRLDWTPSDADTLTLQGDGYSGFVAQPGAEADNIKGANLTGRWTRKGGDGSSLQVQAYYDRTERGTKVNGAFRVDTWDFDLQRGLPLGDRQQLVFGGGYRLTSYKIHGAGGLQWSPDSRDLSLGNVFVQDAISVTPTVDLVLGVKLEDDPYVPPTLLPNVRLSWSATDQLTIWGAVSRAVRSPTPFDRDVVEVQDGAPLLVGGQDFRSEKLVAYELGVKLYASSRASLELTGFYHDYDDLRSVEITPVTLLPLQWGNGMAGRTFGVEAWGQYQLTPWWRLSGGLTHLEEHFRFKPGASGLLGTSQAANDPRYQAQLRSTMKLAPVSLDAWLRYVSDFRDPHQPGYTELNAQVAWDVSPRLRLALDGRNLLHAQHVEYVGGSEIPRSVLAALQWRF